MNDHNFKAQKFFSYGGPTILIYATERETEWFYTDVYYFFGEQLNLNLPPSSVTIPTEKFLRYVENFLCVYFLYVINSVRIEGRRIQFEPNKFLTFISFF